jgi:hypothetical protein
MTNRAVAQVSNLPYRRLPAGNARGAASSTEQSNDADSPTPSRLEVCATEESHL